jgi:hypothetical protein
MYGPTDQVYYITLAAACTPIICTIIFCNHTLSLWFRYKEEEVAEEVRALRASLSSKPRPIDPFSSDSHQMAEASEAKKQQLRNAFGIREDYVEGSAFSQEAQAERAAQEKAKREEKAELYVC